MYVDHSGKKPLRFHMLRLLLYIFIIHACQLISPWSEQSFWRDIASRFARYFCVVVASQRLHFIFPPCSLDFLSTALHLIKSAAFAISVFLGTSSLRMLYGTFLILGRVGLAGFKKEPMMMKHPYHRPVLNCYVLVQSIPKGVEGAIFPCRETRCTTNLGFRYDSSIPPRAYPPQASRLSYSHHFPCFVCFPDTWFCVVLHWTCL